MPVKILVDEENPESNEFFRLREIFQQISQDPEKSDLIKVQLFIQKAIDMYDYLQKVGIELKTVKVLKYKPGKPEPELTEMSLSEAMKEADRSFHNFYDYDSARFNFEQIIKSYQSKLKTFNIFPAFFDHVMQLLSQIKPQFQAIAKLDKRDREKQKLASELTDKNKTVLLLEEQLKEANQQLKEKEEAWQLSTAEIFVNIAENLEMWKFLASLPQWDDLKPEDVGMVSKVISYCVIRGKKEITADEIYKELKIEDVTAITRLPFIILQEKGSKFKIDYEGLKNHLAKNKKVDFRVDKKGWMVVLREKVENYLKKLTGKSSDE